MQSWRSTKHLDRMLWMPYQLSLVLCLKCKSTTICCCYDVLPLPWTLSRSLACGRTVPRFGFQCRPQPFLRLRSRTFVPSRSQAGNYRSLNPDHLSWETTPYFCMCPRGCSLNSTSHHDSFSAQRFRFVRKSSFHLLEIQVECLTFSSRSSCRMRRESRPSSSARWSWQHCLASTFGWPRFSQKFFTDCTHHHKVHKATCSRLACIWRKRSTKRKPRRARRRKLMRWQRTYSSSPCLPGRTCPRSCGF